MGIVVSSVTSTCWFRIWAVPINSYGTAFVPGEKQVKVTRLAKFCAVVAALLASLPMLGQSTAELRGTVSDAAGAPVVSAFVLIEATGTALIRAATTDDRGIFEFSSLPVGTYRLRVTAEGFRSIQISEVRLSIGQVANVRFKVVPGQGTLEQAHASSGDGMVETGDTQLGVVMGEQIIAALPLKSRDAFELLQLQPGVQSTVGADLFYGGDRPGVVSVNGGRARSNNYLVNGGYSAEQFVNAPSVQPSTDNILEFRVISHNYAAELGRNSGSVLNVITKSGYNGFHGLLYEYLRNDVLNARGYFDLDKPAFKQNDFGATFGGSLRRDKTFYSLSYEGRRLRRGITSDTVTVPTALERRGDFSAGPTPFTGTLNDQNVAEILNARPGCAAAVSAREGAAITAGTAYESIFPGNVIPAECFDATAFALLNRFVPSATVGDSEYRNSGAASDRDDQFMARLDHNITSQQQLSFFYYAQDGHATDPFSRFQGSGGNVLGFGSKTRQRFQQVNLSHAWTMNAKTTNELRIVYYRQGQGDLMSPSRTNLVQASCGEGASSECFSDPAHPLLGVSPGYGASREGVPFIALAGGFAIGNNPNGNFAQVGNVYQLSEIHSKVLGTHTVRFGADIRNQRLDQTYFYAINGDIEFSGGGPNDVGFDNLLPNYLLGLPDTYVQGSGNVVNVRATQLQLFAQDSWKLRPNVTVNYGLRWEFNTPQADAGKRVQAFRPGQATSIYGCQLNPSNPLGDDIGSTDCSPSGSASSLFPMGLVFPGDKNVPSGLTNNYYRSFAPRLGVAWSPGWNDGWMAKLTGGPGRTSVRLGWGMFYDANEELVLSAFSAQPPFGGSTFLTNPMFNTPFLSQDGTENPNPFHGFLDPARGSAVDFSLFRPILLYGNFPETLRSQYSIQYHLTVQRELLHNTLLQVGYVGSRGHRLLATIDQNYGNPQTCLDLNQVPGISCGPFGADESYVVPAGAIPDGVTVHLPYGSVPSVTGPNATPITLVGLRRYSSPLCEPTTGEGCPQDGVPVFGSIFAMQPIANSSYDSLQALVRHKLARGNEFTAAYTFSKSMDNASSVENLLNPLDPSRSRSLSLFDARHRFVLSYYWQIPKTGISNWTRHVLNDWTLSGIAIVQSGFPIRIISYSDRELMSSLGYETPGQPDQVAAFKRLDPRARGGYYFDPASFAESPLGQIGNAPRTVCCGPGTANLDLAVNKSFRVAESKKLEFRTEVFNVLNHTQFFNPDGNITGTDTFGRVRRARDPRLLQFAMRLSF